MIHLIFYTSLLLRVFCNVKKFNFRLVQRVISKRLRVKLLKSDKFLLLILRYYNLSYFILLKEGFYRMHNL